MLDVIVPVAVAGLEQGFEGVEVRRVLVDLQSPEPRDGRCYEAEMHPECLGDLSSVATGRWPVPPCASLRWLWFATARRTLSWAACANGAPGSWRESPDNPGHLLPCTRPASLPPPRARRPRHKATTSGGTSAMRGGQAKSSVSVQGRRLQPAFPPRSSRRS